MCCLPSFDIVSSFSSPAPMSQHCAQQASHWCHIYLPKSGDCFVKKMVMKEVQLHLHWWKLEPFHFILHKKKEKKKKIVSAVRKLQPFKDSDCMFCARVRKTSGARNCCVPEVLALKGLILVTIMKDFAGHFSIRVWEKQQQLAIVYSEEIHASSDREHHDPSAALPAFSVWDIAKYRFLCCAFCSLGTEFSGNSKQRLVFPLQSTRVCRFSGSLVEIIFRSFSLRRRWKYFQFSENTTIF